MPFSRTNSTEISVTRDTLLPPLRSLYQGKPQGLWGEALNLQTRLRFRGRGVTVGIAIAHAVADLVIELEACVDGGASLMRVLLRENGRVENGACLSAPAISFQSSGPFG